MGVGPLPLPPDSRPLSPAPEPLREPLPLPLLLLPLVCPAARAARPAATGSSLELPLLPVPALLLCSSRKADTCADAAAAACCAAACVAWNAWAELAAAAVGEMVGMSCCSSGAMASLGM